MKVRIICYEDLNQWILGKFALRLAEHLKKKGVEVDIAKVPSPLADINHHIIYYNYDGAKTTTETVMITHIDTDEKVNQLKQQLILAEMGICMSNDTVQKLAARGLPRQKLCYVNPAHDQVMKPRKTVVGITSKVQPSGCKRETMLAQLGDTISPDDFKFIIMGSGWEAVIKILKQKGIEVDYFKRFDYKTYVKWMPTFDYYLYMGQDEGSMGFIDALAAGIPTIVTPQGYHLDITDGITYSFNEIDELVNVFKEIAGLKKRRVQSVSTWTWADYARKHLLIWEYVLARKKDGARLTPELEQLGVR
jgi:hypothetical protein